MCLQSRSLLNLQVFWSRAAAQDSPLWQGLECYILTDVSGEPTPLTTKSFGELSVSAVVSQAFDARFVRHIRSQPGPHMHDEP